LNKGEDIPAVNYNALHMPACVLNYDVYPDPPEVEAEYPVYVMNVDNDGNGLAGIRLPDIQVPIGTYTGWNRTNEAWGGDDRLCTAGGSGEVAVNNAKLDSLFVLKTLVDPDAHANRRGPQYR
jgi:hypothetical protein